jgi:hypothetical protein
VPAIHDGRFRHVVDAVLRYEPKVLRGLTWSHFGYVALLATAFGIARAVQDVDPLDKIAWEWMPKFSIAGLMVLLCAVALVALYARADATWPAQVPMGALALGVAFLYAFFQIATAVVVLFARRLPAAELNPLYTAISVAAALALLSAALWLIVHGRAHNRANLRAAGFSWPRWVCCSSR